MPLHPDVKARLLAAFQRRIDIERPLAALKENEVTVTQDSKIKLHVAEVTRHDGPIMLPKDMTEDAAIEVLTRRKEYDKEKVAINEAVNCYPWDGAIALEKALTEQFGFALQQAEWSMFGKQPPKRIQLEVDVDRTITIPWGKFTLPGIEGWVQTATSIAHGKLVFAMNSEVLRRYEPMVRKLMDRTRELAMGRSIYTGKALQMKFRDGNGESLPLPMPTFLRLSRTNPIFNEELENAIIANILIPIRHTARCRSLNIPLKRGILLPGRFGTGKTLIASWVAREATANDWTVIYCTEPAELTDALKFAQYFMPSVVFCEDVDRIAGANRDDEVNDLLNTLDGIGSKTDEIILILTSNNPDNINAAMRRPGRIDTILPIDPPDAPTAQRLLRAYGGPLISSDENLATVGDMLAGQIPAVIREVVERSKLEALRRSPTGSIQLLSNDLEVTTTTLKREQELFRAAPTVDPVAEWAKGFIRLTKVWIDDIDS